MGVPRSPLARRYYRAAKQRIADAEQLLTSERTTGAVYLRGYGVECMLKALVLAVTPASQVGTTLGQFQGARAHDLGWLLYVYFERSGVRLPARFLPVFVRVRAWTTELRYSPDTLTSSDARTFLDAAHDVITWADQQV